MSLAGWFYDGDSARRQDVTAEAQPRGLVIRDRSGVQLACWPWDELNRSPSADGSWRLSRGPASEARLFLPDQPGLDALAAQAPQITRRALSLSRLRAGLGLAVLVLAVLTGLYFALPALARPVARALPVQWVDSLGARLADGLVAQHKACGAEAGQQALDRLVRSLAPETPDRFTLRVVAWKMNNAFTTGGGQILLLSGLIAEARSPDELAGVLAHEMAHDQLNHVAERLVREAALGLAITALTGEPSGAVAVVLGNLTSLSYSREDEAAADALARRMLTRAGYGTAGMGAFFQRLAEQEGIPEMLSSHPDSATRAQASGAIPATRPALTPEEWQAVKAMCPEA